MTETCTSGDLEAGRLQICGYLHSQQCEHKHAVITPSSRLRRQPSWRPGQVMLRAQGRNALHNFVDGNDVSLKPKAKLKVVCCIVCSASSAQARR
jgi:hypothetical protein